MLEIGQSNYERAIGRRGQMSKLWKDKRYIYALVLYGFLVCAVALVCVCLVWLSSD